MSGVNTLSGVRRILTADCYVLASGLGSCPTKILEASLMREPVIAGSVAGVPETVLEVGLVGLFKTSPPWNGFRLSTSS